MDAMEVGRMILIWIIVIGAALVTIVRLLTPADRSRQ